MSLTLDKSTWKRVRLGDVLRRSRTQVDPLESGVERYVAGGHIDGGSITIDRWGDPSDGQMGSTFRHVFEPGQILFVSARPYLRKSGVVDFSGVVADKTYVLEAIPENGLLQEFLPFVLASDPFIEYATAEATGSMNPRLLWGPFQRYELALPPLDEQRRIADVFWAIERHCRSLTSLLDVQAASNRVAFSQLLEGEDAEARMLGDVGRFTRGRRFTKADYVSEGLGCVHYAQIHTDFGIKASTPLTYVPEAMRSSLRLAHAGDLIIAGTSEDVEGVGKAVAWLGDDVAVHDDCFVYSHTLDPVFASYLFASAEFDHQKRSFVSESKVVRLSAGNLAKSVLPIPDEPGQKRVSEAMDEIARSADAVERERATATALREALSVTIFGDD